MFNDCHAVRSWYVLDCMCPLAPEYGTVAVSNLYLGPVRGHGYISEKHDEDLRESKKLEPAQSVPQPIYLPPSSLATARSRV